MKYFLATFVLLIAATACAQVRPNDFQPILRSSITESPLLPFADFEVQVEVESQEFEVRGVFTLSSTTDGINLFKEDVSFAVGTYSRTIRAGSFRKESRGKIRYDEITKDGSLTVKIRMAGNNKFTIKIEAEGVKMPKGLKAQDVMLTIGDDGGGPAREIAQRP